MIYVCEVQQRGSRVMPLKENPFISIYRLCLLPQLLSHLNDICYGLSYFLWQSVGKDILIVISDLSTQYWSVS